MSFLVAILSSAVILALSVRFLNFLQLDGYAVKYRKPARVAHLKLCGAAAVSFAACFAMYGCRISASAAYEALAVAFCLIVQTSYAVYLYKTPSKKPIVWTPRAQRLFFTLALIVCVLESLLCFGGANIFWKGVPMTYIFIGLPTFVLPFLIYLAAFVNKPLERLIAKRYVKRAEEFFKSRPNLIRIGITGSYGKTGVKFILKKMLAEMYEVAATPDSYNTPMGICRSTELIKPETEIFIAEMGARRRGDIKELCDVVKPSYGIITGVTTQHLETFKTVENVAATKYELAEGVAKGGYVVFNGDNPYTLDMYSKTDKNKGTASLASGDCIAENIVTTATGSEFDLVIGERKIACNTVLIGRHNVLNIAMAALMAYKLGVSLNQIAHAVCRLEPAPHRLEVLRLPTGVNVIDDSYNSNEIGFAAALDTLSLFEGRKVVVTPGLVELGDAEIQKNRELGAKIAKVADAAFLIGARGGDIRSGMIEAGFLEENIYLFQTLNEAQERFGELLKKRDVVLLENDLPDNY